MAHHFCLSHTDHLTQNPKLEIRIGSVVKAFPAFPTPHNTSGFFLLNGSNRVHNGPPPWQSHGSNKIQVTNRPTQNLTLNSKFYTLTPKPITLNSLSFSCQPVIFLGNRLQVSNRVNKGDIKCAAKQSAAPEDTPTGQIFKRRFQKVCQPNLKTGQQ